MKRLLIVVLLLILAALPSVAAAHGGGSAGHLADHGWTCFPVPPDGDMHCIRPGAWGNALNVHVFDPTGEIFFGAELLLAAHLYNGQPCMPEGGHEYHLVEPAPGVYYYACHHYSH